MKPTNLGRLQATAHRIKKRKANRKKERQNKKKGRK